ncbi:hypothetical protein AN219_38015 [Streptomyces nanshensis]|nr:hypothetical protein AN219_38015 [Streptomyces nanshensis]
MPARPGPVRCLPWLVVVLPQRVGLWALELMVTEGVPVGPVMVCEQHRTVRIPVPADAADSPLTARLELSWELECAGAGELCAEQDWLLPPRTAHVGVLTDYRSLCDCLQHVTRSPFRRAA